jgi:uncharacterized cupredoxin-like copper-binding protein
MSEEPRTSTTRRLSGWAVLLVAVAAIATVMTATAAGVAGGGFAGMMDGAGRMMDAGGGAGSMMGGGGGSAGSMMGGAWGESRPGSVSGAGPGTAGFVAGTASAPRVVRIAAGPGYAFSPSTIRVKAGETVTFVVTTMGPRAHEFMMGPADAVAGDVAGTPEIADIGMMQSKSLTYTFAGAGPFAFACHAVGHYEAGMAGTIVLVP